MNLNTVERVPLGELCIKIGSGSTPRGGATIYVDNGTALIRSQNVYNSMFSTTGLVYITESIAEKMIGVSVEVDDVLLNITGSVARCCRVPNEVLPARVNQHVTIIRTDKGLLHPSYLANFLVSPHMQAKMLSWAGSGGTRKALTKGMIEDFEIPLPPLETQKRIAEVFSAYEDLIENNRRRIALLEAVTLELYKEWFVRFRYPGHDQVPLINGIPKGWEFKRIVDLAEIIMGQSPKSEFYNMEGEGLPFHQGVSNFGFRYLIHRTYCTKPIRLSQPGDILFSVRAPVGRMNLTDNKIIIGRGLSAMRSRTGNQSFLFYQLKVFFFKEDMVGGGSIFTAVTKKQLENQKMLLPPKHLVDQFEDFASQIDKQIKLLTQSSVMLVKSHGLLLPKLMNRELIV